MDGMSVATWSRRALNWYESAWRRDRGQAADVQRVAIPAQGRRDRPDHDQGPALWRNKVIFFGNGGSAQDAGHLAAELMGRFAFDRPGLPRSAFPTPRRR